MSTSLAVVAGSISACLFAAAALPMLVKAAATRDMRSYSLPHLVTTNVANLVHTLYVVQLPPGPIWALHGFSLVTYAAMLVGYVVLAPRPVVGPVSGRAPAPSRGRRRNR